MESKLPTHKVPCLTCHKKIPYNKMLHVDGASSCDDCTKKAVVEFRKKVTTDHDRITKSVLDHLGRLSFKEAIKEVWLIDDGWKLLVLLDEDTDELGCLCYDCRDRKKWVEFNSKICDLTMENNIDFSSRISFADIHVLDIPYHGHHAEIWKDRKE